ncbi:LPXTG cell wall anchor domain-containing protein [Enterococcus rotai]|uniref:LPXTG cell wall anchor domain-containing protein n=1 Tax=Enterococcus rotai TaxID=118060 RepID=UPI0032B37904
MRKTTIALISLILIAVSLLPFSKVAESVSYNSEIGLTFYNHETPESSTSSSSTESSTSSSTTSDSDTFTTTMTKAGSNKLEKGGKLSFLPSTGYKNSSLFLLLGLFLMIISLSKLGFKVFHTVKKNRHQ